MSKNINYDLKKLNFLPIILGIYIFLVGVGLPLVVWNRYFDILVAKYWYYCGCTILMLLALLLYLPTRGGETIELYFREFTIKKFFEKFTVADYAVLAYLFIAMISTATSDFLFESFWGNEGRYTGLFLITLYVVSYFCISRLCEVKKKYIDWILAAGILVCLFGITDYFKMDIFHFKALMIPIQRAAFTSTIGNINTYTAYVGIIVAIGTVLFTMSNHIKQVTWYYTCMVIGFFSIIMGTSDNAYLSLGTLFAFLPLVLFKYKGGIFRYLIVLASFFSVIQCIDWINRYFGERVLGIDSVFKMITNSEKLLYIVIVLWAIVIVWYFLRRSKIIKEEKCGKVLRYIWLVMIILAFLVLMYLLYDCNVAGNSERYGSLRNYLLFNDSWGTNRGYIWRNAMERFMELSWWKKIVGYGPETFGLLIMKQTANNPYNELFDNAHNEYLQTLTTLGIAGLTAYLIFIFAYLKRCFSCKKKNPFVIAMAFGVFCYSTQAFVNLNLPIVSPVFWLLLGMGAAKSVEKKE